MAHPERLIEFYSGAKISLLLVSGDFKAEFPRSGIETVKAQTLQAIRAKVAETIVAGDLAKPFEAYAPNYSSFEPPEKVKVIGVRATPKGGKVLVYEKADGTHGHAERLYRPSAEYDDALAETAAARAAHEDTESAYAEARRKLEEVQGRIAFGAASARAISEEVA